MKERLRNWRRWTKKGIENVRQGMAQTADQQVGLISLLVLIGLVAWLVLGLYSGAWSEIWQGVYIEGAGALMDLVVFGIIIGIALALTERK